MYKNILVPLDGSKRAEEGICSAFNLSRVLGAKITLMQVGESLNISDALQVEEDECRFTEKAERYLCKVKEELEARGADVRIVTKTGNAINEICMYAERDDVDLIVMTPYGSNPGLQTSVGSVSWHLLQCAPKPILLLRGRLISVLEGFSILLVDDDPDVLESVEGALDMCIVYKASDSNTALKFLECRSFDVLLLDITCVNGGEILQHAIDKGVLTVVFTAKARMKKMPAQSHDPDCVCFLPKEKISEIKTFLEKTVKAKNNTIPAP